MTRLRKRIFAMRNWLFASPGRTGRRPLAQAGFTLIEIAFAVEVMMLLSLVAFNETRRLKEQALVSACMRYEGVLQRNLWANFALDGEFPQDINAMLAKMPRGSQDKLYLYKPIGGGGAGGAEQFYIRCGHDHSYVGVLFNDTGAYFPPKPIYALAAARGNL